MPENDQSEQKEQKQEIPAIYIPRGGLKGSVSGTAIKTAARGIVGFFAANPWIWIVLGIIILSIIVFVIVVSGVAPGAPPQTTTPTPAP